MIFFGSKRKLKILIFSSANYKNITADGRGLVLGPELAHLSSFESIGGTENDDDDDDNDNNFADVRFESGATLPIIADGRISTPSSRATKSNTFFRGFFHHSSNFHHLVFFFPPDFSFEGL